MKFGISTFITDQGIRPVPLGKALEARAFDSLFIAEHSHIPVDRESPYPGGGELPEIYYRTLDPFVALSAIGVVTERLLLATGIALIPERDPLMTAKEVATLDLLSGGRAILGVGIGWNREEMRNHGTDPSTRGRLTDERLGAITQLWTTEKAEFHGDFVDFDPVYSWPKPVQRPHPPIYVGGGEGAFARVVRYGDAWLANGVPPEQLGPQIERLRSLAGRDVPVTVYGVPGDQGQVEGYLALGVERVLFSLPTVPEGETLEELDRLAEVAARYR
ncbi:LLM class F420-dependent oxidoreductase [Streptomyces nodosus]|uniref:5,10-methylene tetrahydromethanopterin reductase n=1 Tax=Streptomyces nodosus TaxID=40318 RepID=A0A0B5DLU2_9ACTN|nr:LLM class F420-dependent oxidoreductase [Streptomyces nodosus]AJE44169.1 5,10-methylene tetrahydromethanopterin reductase [Streptomyces nodosus]MBB4795770.1 putative F420-dependent oxidoreductase [Streptomyces nodosus]QEV42655.1 LLM class F420-dependent oxidoreductase [Streptomyces nodosus]